MREHGRQLLPRALPPRIKCPSGLRLLLLLPFDFLDDKIRPESVSRFRRFRSARISAALW